MNKIILSWYDPDGNLQKEEMDEVFKKANYQTYKELCDMCERWVEDAIIEYGSKEWILSYSPYQKIKFVVDGKTKEYWSVSKYLKERRYI